MNYWKKQIPLDFKLFFKYMLFIFLLLSSSFCLAATSTPKLWLAPSIDKKTEHLLYFFQPNLRFLQQNMRLQEALPEVGVGYFFTNNASIFLAASWANKDDDVNVNKQERRAWQQLNYSYKQKSLEWLGRSRIEERRLIGDNNLSLRLRQRLRLLVPISNHLSIDAHEEIMINLVRPAWISTKTLDQNRSYIGLQGRINSKIKLNFGYMNQYLYKTPAEIGQIAVVGLDVSLDN